MAIQNTPISVCNKVYKHDVIFPPGAKLERVVAHKQITSVYGSLILENSIFLKEVTSSADVQLTSCNATKVNALYGLVKAERSQIETVMSGSGVELTDCQGKTIFTKAGRATIQNTEDHIRDKPQDFLSIEAPVSVTLKNVSVQQVYCTSGSIAATQSEIDLLQAHDTIRLIDSVATAVLFAVHPGNIYDLYLEGSSEVLGPILVHKKKEPMQAPQLNVPKPIDYIDTLKCYGKEKIPDQVDREEKNNFLKSDFPFLKGAIIAPLADAEEPVTLRIHGESDPEQIHFIGCTGRVIHSA